MAHTGKNLQFFQISGITKCRMPKRLKYSSHILPNVSGNVLYLFLVSIIGEEFIALALSISLSLSLSLTHTHTHTHVTVAILTILGSQHNRKAVSFTPGAARSGSVRLSNVTPAFQLTEVKVASLRSSHTITQHYTFPQLSHAVKTLTIRSIFTHTRRTHCGNKKRQASRNSTNRWRCFKLST